MARKTIVLYVVQKLQQDFPQASKTSVGHVVQLLYRASCFNVSQSLNSSDSVATLISKSISPLMWPKVPCFDYETLFSS